MRETPKIILKASVLMSLLHRLSLNRSTLSVFHLTYFKQCKTFIVNCSAGSSLGNQVQVMPISNVRRYLCTMKTFYWNNIFLIVKKKLWALLYPYIIQILFWQTSKILHMGKIVFDLFQTAFWFVVCPRFMPPWFSLLTLAAFGT